MESTGYIQKEETIAKCTGDVWKINADILNYFTRSNWKKSNI
jgi:hypothetical protein